MTPAPGTILIAGANRGLGREFVRQFLEAGWQVHATARRDDGCRTLEAAGAVAHRLDIDSDGEIAALAGALDGVAFDAVLANAGISGNLELTPPEIELAEMQRVVGTNMVSVLLFMRAFKPHLLAGRRRAALAMSSLMSSISSNDWSTQYCYRASKTALNAAWRSLASEWRADGITCALLRPGLVATDMTGFRGMAPEVSVKGMVGVVERLRPEDSGRCIGYDGLDVPW